VPEFDGLLVPLPSTPAGPAGRDGVEHCLLAHHCQIPGILAAGRGRYPGRAQQQRDHLVTDGFWHVIADASPTVKHCQSWIERLTHEVS